jgi:hypothetical protein
MNIIIKDDASPLIRNLRDYSARINPRIGQAVAQLVRDHLFAKGKNKRGYPSTGFYASAAKSTSWHLTGNGVVVSIAKQGIRQRLEGGTIHAKPESYLTIPARSEAYGKRAREFGNLKIQFGKRKDGSIGPVALVADKGGATKKIFQGREGAGKETQYRTLPEGMVVYWLVKEAKQAADPSVIPTRERILQTALQTAQTAMHLFQARGGTS